MRKNERGFSLIEMIMVCAIIVIIGSGTFMTLYQINRNSKLNNDYLTVVTQINSAGDWISRDAQSAEFIAVNGLNFPDFISLSWEERDFDGGNSIQYMVTYYFADLENGVGTLKRHYWTSGGINRDTWVANRIYFAPQDPDETSSASYVNPVLNIKLRSVSGTLNEVKEYNIQRRPDFDY